MRRVLEGEQDLFEQREIEEQRDVVLGTSALLGIFLAVALVCAVCFGFGYSEGHGIRAVTGAPTAAKDRPAPRPLGGTRTAEEPSLGTAAKKPAPGLMEAAPSGEVPGMPPETDISEAIPTRRAGLPSAAVANGPSLARKGEMPLMPGTAPSTPPAAPEATRVTPPEVANSEAANLEAANLMVQIAAVSRAADAQTLASALRHDGFAAVVRTATADSLFHVQIGPFASFAAAKAMRARLADNGYNAFIKP